MSQSKPILKTVSINLGTRSYDICIGVDLLDSDQELLPWIHSNQVLIITNEIVAPLYLEKVKNSLGNKKSYEIILPDGENTKSLQTAETIFDRMLEIPLDRSATIIALGGGVIGDLAGFVAACYQRGIPFIQIPTTLLSQVDSSVGGKTAVNHPRGKNMIGAFYQPRKVVADISTLNSLDPRQFSSGLAEVIKYGIINDLTFFQWLEDNLDLVMKKDTVSLSFVIEQSCLNKAKIVELDEREGGIRALLNLGHTFGHAIETATGYGKWLHGEAVALGMVMAAHMSWQSGWIGEDDLNKITNLLSRAELPVSPSDEFSADELYALMQVDKKVVDGVPKLVLLKAIGKATLTGEYDQNALQRTLVHFATG